MAMGIIENILRKHFKRFIAFFIDWFIVLIPNILVGICMEIYFKGHSFANFFEIQLGFTYFIYFTFFSAKYGHTIGKKLAKLKVVNLKDNSPINAITSVYRHLPLSLLFMVSAFAPTTGEGFQLNVSTACTNIPRLWILSEMAFYLIKNNGQMLHDYIAKTKVIESN